MTSDRLAQLDWDVIGYTPQSAHMHMAVDEVLLQRVMTGSRRPTVRFWEWIEPALGIGSPPSVANEGDRVPAPQLRFTGTRRMSGGGGPRLPPARGATPPHVLA